MAQNESRGCRNNAAAPERLGTPQAFGYQGCHCHFFRVGKSSGRPQVNSDRLSIDLPDLAISIVTSQEAVHVLPRGSKVKVAPELGDENSPRLAAKAVLTLIRPKARDTAFEEAWRISPRSAPRWH